MRDTRKCKETKSKVFSRQQCNIQVSFHLVVGLKALQVFVVVSASRAELFITSLSLVRAKRVRESRFLVNEAARCRRELRC